MRALIFLTLLAVSIIARAGQFEACTPYSPTEKPLKRAPRVLQAKAELDADRDRTYAASERLRGRAFRDASTLVIPHNGVTVPVPAALADGIAAHLHAALSERYADAVVYADMGHLHLLLPDEDWKQIHPADGPVDMAAVLAAPNLKALYHTAEMIQLKDGDFAKGRLSQDPWKQWRYFSRNLLGTFGLEPRLEVLLDALQAMYNTVRELPGMTQVSTLYISANRGGCLPFRGSAFEDMRFDMTFEEIPYSNP